MLSVYVDIETIPQQPEEESLRRIMETIQPPATMSKPETIKEWMENTGKYAENGRKQAAEEVYRRTALDGARGQICSIAWAYNKEPEIYNMNTGLHKCTELQLLTEFFRMISYRMIGASTSSLSPFFIGHNIGDFDLPYLFHRAVINQARPNFVIPHDGRHGQHYFDTMKAWAGYKNRISADDLCIALGYQSRAEHGDIHGSEVWDAYKAGKFELISEHNIEDIRRNRFMHSRLTWGV